MAYYIDLSQITLRDYKSRLATSYLPPSRMILKENVDERLDYFISEGIENVDELLKTLKNSKEFSRFSGVNLFSEGYLTILLRELKSIHPRPNRIADFPGISKKLVNALEKKGIKNTFRLYDFVRTPGDRKQLASETAI